MPSGGGYSLYEMPAPTHLVQDQPYVTFGIDASFAGLFIGGTLRTNMWPHTDSLNARPNALASFISGGWRNNWLEIGIRHECIHPVVPYLPVIPVRVLWEGAVTEVYMRATVKWQR